MSLPCSVLSKQEKSVAGLIYSELVVFWGTFRQVVCPHQQLHPQNHRKSKDISMLSSKFGVLFGFLLLSHLILRRMMWTRSLILAQLRMKPCHFDKVFQMMTACVAIFIHIRFFLEPVGSACQKVQ